MKYRLLFSLLAVWSLSAFGGELVWFDGRQPVSVSVPKQHSKVLDVALQLFRDDMLAVTGMEPVLKRKGIIEVVEENRGDDGFSLSVSKGRIRVAGHSGRGAAYGLLELSRMAGVSPWVWWGDLAPEQKSRLTIAGDYRMEHVPSVAYRGIFINDEDWSTRVWSKEQGARSSRQGTRIATEVTTGVYRKIFELLLRLRANTLWPAMHEGTTAFFLTEGAREMADSCGIVIGTSHCEPMLRNNVGEWDVDERGRFNYITNGDAVCKYWQERLDEVSTGTGNYLFTIGMRGIHDGSMEGVSTMAEKTAALQQVIDDQRTMLAASTLSRFPQVFVPYKEVLEIFENGLRVPDDVMLMWCDDNYGYLTRLSDEAQQRRSGGAGVYYHLSYWGRPHDYLWLTTTQPGLIFEEMRQAYDHGVRREWIANVHDVKVAAYDLELFLDMAWDINSVGPSTVEQHLRQWLCRQYGQRVGERVFPAMREFYRLCSIRRPEFMGWTQVELDKRKYDRGLSTVTQVGMTAAEARDYLKAYERIVALVTDAQHEVRGEWADSYFAHVIYPVCAASAMAHKILSTDKTESSRAYDEIQQLTVRYNQLAGGKWRGLMDAAPRRLPVFENVNARLLPDSVRGSVMLNCAAADYTTATEGAVVTQMLGHSMRAVQLPKGGRLTYDFSLQEGGAVVLTTALIPTQPNDKGDLRYSVSIDGAEPVVYSLKEPFRSERWKENVLCGQALRSLPVTLAAGQHQLVIEALDQHVVVDEWRMEAQGNR